MPWPLGIDSDDRYRTVDEPRVLDAIAFMGYLYEDDREAARRDSAEALRTWIDCGLAFARAPDGRRLFDLVEVNNFIRTPPCEEFYRRRVVGSIRRFVSETRSDPAPERRFAIDFERTFDVRSLAAGTNVRLRAPLPRTGRTHHDLEVRPRARPELGLRLSVTQGRLEAAGVVPEPRSVGFGAEIVCTFASERTGGADGPPPEGLAPYLREREGLIAVTPRIVASAASITARSTSPAQAVRRIWQFLCSNLVHGSVHHDEIDLERPCDWALDRGWVDCRLASSLFVALCRARGMPARVCGGYLFSPRATMLHHWADVWLDGRWFPVDFMSWDLSAGGRDPEWLDHFYGKLDDRLETERFPRDFTGALGVPVPKAWSLMQTSNDGATRIAFLDDAGSPVYVDTVRVERLPAS